LWERVVESLALATEKSPTSAPPSARAPDKPAKAPFFVWIVEDVHAADLGTLDLLTLLAQPLGALRALVVVTARLQDPRITDRVSQRLVRMCRDGLEIRLEPLGKLEIKALAERTAGRSLPADAGAELAELTGGNPLFVIECARAFAARGATAKSIVSLPQTVRQVVTERLYLLNRVTIEALSASAVLGREAAAATVGRMLDKLPAQIIDALNPALRAGIIVETRPARFSFTHILVRDAVEEAIGAAERAELHARAEAALATQGDGAEILVERARHALASLRDGQGAVDLALRAAHLLEEQGAFDRAYAMYERVADARRAGWARPANAEESLRCARVAQKAGKFGAAQAVCEELIESARKGRDAELLARAALVMGSEIRPAVVSRALVGALEEALRALERQEQGHPLSCVVQARLAAAMQPSLDATRPIAMARDAIARARTLGDETRLLEVLHLACAAIIDAVPSDELAAIMQETLDRALHLNDTSKAVQALARLTVLHCEAGDVGAWWSTTDRALDLSHDLDSPSQRWRPLLLASMRAVARGDVAESDQILVEVQQLASVSDDPGLILSLLAHTSGVARLLHRDEQIGHFRQFFQPSPDIPHSALIYPTLSAGHLARMEDRDAVAAELSRVLGRTGAVEYGFFGLLLAEAHACVGNLEDCVRLREKLRSTATRNLSAGHVGMTYEGPVVRVLGILDSAIGDHAAAEAKLREALATVTMAGLRAWSAQCHYDLGAALVRAGRARDGAPHFAEAAHLAEEIGMPGLVVRARARIAAPASSAPPPSSSAPRTFSMSAEGDVWRIAFDRRSFAVKDSRGMQLLARLVERKGEEIHVLTLASDEEGSTLFDTTGAAGIDARARSEYKARLCDLEDALAEAERGGDAGRAAKLRREKSMLESEIARSFGIGGKSRASGSPSERARVNVQRRLKDAIARVGECDAAAGRFLEKAVRTGTYCCFFA
jgi:tetratricopeptide (TPR) repeat protein